MFELGETPVVAPPTPLPPSSATGIPRDGLNGRAGEDGEDAKDGANAPAPTDAQILAKLQAFCLQFACRGEDGRDSVDGAKGDKGDPSTVPGPQGPPGPTCPDGYTTQTVWVSASDTQVEIPTPRQAVICMPPPTTPPTEPSQGESTP